MRWKVGLAIVVGAPVIVLAGWLVHRAHCPAVPQPPIPIPPFSSSPYLNTRADAHYVGITGCKECHETKYLSYLHTAHSQALSELNPKTEPPDGEYEHKPSGRTYRVFREGNQFHHEEVMRTPEGQEIARMKLPIRYLIGSGHFSRSYLVEVDGFLCESPITWYTQQKRWAMSPGYDVPEHPGFGRPVTVDCLVCHAGRVTPAGDASSRATILERPIGCESCHGPGAHHVKYQRTAKHPPGEDDVTIVNPGKLPRRLLESVCAACHLQGLAAIDVRGRTIKDFRPGLPLSDYRLHYFFDGKNDQMKVVGHFEQLRQSKCYQKSEEMSCLTCHNPHLREKPKDTVAYYRRRCLSCHETQKCTLEEAQRLKKDPTDNCTACHMPRGDTDIPHIAFTHHRIGLHAARSQPDSDGLSNLVAFEDAPQFSELDRQRNLGLAYVVAASRATERGLTEAYLTRALGLLEPVHKAGLRDAGTLEGLATIHWRNQDFAEASSFARAALAADDLSIDGRFKALEVLLEGHLHNQEFEEASAILEKLTRRRRFAEDWRLLGAVYLKLDKPEKAVDAFHLALAINPFRSQSHAGLADAYRRLGDLARAKQHADQAQWLAKPRK